MRTWKDKRKTMRHYDRQAEIYDAAYVGEQNAKTEDILKATKFGSDDAVLDLGCGTGFLFQYVPQTAFLVGVDVSKKCLRQAKKRTTNMPNTELIQADADNLPFIDHVFDKIFAITVLQNMPDPTATIAEMIRTSKKEAIFAVTGLKKKFTKESFIELLEGAHLKVVSYNTNEQLKGHVAVCTN